MDIFVDFSAGGNGDGSVATPFNTLVGMGESDGDKVWIRRDTSFTLAAYFYLASNVSYYGYPVSGDVGYENRPANAAWDADAAVFPTIHTVASTALRLERVIKVGLYNINLSRSTSSYPIHLSYTYKCSIINCTFTITGNSSVFLSVSISYNLVIDRLTINAERTRSSGDSIILGSIRGGYARINVNISQDSNYSSSLCKMDASWRLDVVLDVVYTSAGVSRSVIFSGTNTYKSTASATVSAIHPDSSFGLAGLSGINYLYLKAKSAYMTINGSSFPRTSTDGFHIVTDRLYNSSTLSIPIYGNAANPIYLYPYTPGQTISIASHNTGQSMKLVAGHHIYLPKIAGLLADINSQTTADDILLTWTDENDVWRFMFGGGGGHSTSVARTGGGDAIRVNYDIQSSNSSRDIPPALLGSTMAEFITVPLAAGSHTVSIYYAIKEMGYTTNDLSLKVVVVWSDNGRRRESSMTPLEDNSVWVGDVGLITKKVSVPIILSTPSTVAVRLEFQIDQPATIPNPYGYIDTTPVIT